MRPLYYSTSDFRQAYGISLPHSLEADDLPMTIVLLGVMLFKLFALVGFAAHAIAQVPGLVSTLKSNSAELSNFTALINSQPEFLAQLSTINNVTVFAPTNQAISAFLNTTYSATIAQDSSALAALLSYHVLNGTYSTFNTNNPAFHTFLTNSRYSNVTGGQRVVAAGNAVYSGSAQRSNILQTLVFSGGVLHTIDSVLVIPPLLSAAAPKYGFSLFEEASNTAGLSTIFDLNKDMTFFIPNDTAFQRIRSLSGLASMTTPQLYNLLAYHAVNNTVLYSGQLHRNQTLSSLQGNPITITMSTTNTTFVNNARIIVSNALVANGVVHVIDTVLDPNNTTPPIPSSTEDVGLLRGTNPSSTSSTRIGAGAIAGIVVGVIIVIAIILIVVFLLGRHKNEKDSTRSETQPAEPAPPKPVVSELRSGQRANRHELGESEPSGPPYEKDGTSAVYKEAKTIVENRSGTYELSPEAHK